MARTSASGVPLRRGGIAAVTGVLLSSIIVFPPSADIFQAPRLVLVLATAAFALWSTSRSRRGRYGRLVGTLVAVAAVLFVVSALSNGVPSAIWGVHGRLQGLVTAATFVLVGVVGYVAVGPFLDRLAVGAAVPVIVVTGVVLVQILSGDPGAGTMGNAALAGGWLAVAVSICVAAYIRTSGRLKWLMAAAAAVGTLAAGMTGSRGAWVGLAFGVGAVLVGSAERRVWKTVIPIVAVSLLVGGVLAGPVVGWKLSLENLTSGSAASRLRIWDDSSDLITDAPLLGVGPGRYLYEIPRYQSVEHALIEGPDIRPDQAHSIPLHTAAESGVPASVLLMVAWAVAVFVAGRGARRGHPGSLVALAGLGAYGGQALFGISTVETDSLAWLVGGAGLAVADIALTRDRGPEDGVPAPARDRIAIRAAAIVAALACCASIYYVGNDSRDARGDEYFAAAEFDDAWLAYDGAVRGNPWVDTYRLDLSDAASYLVATGDGSRLIETLVVIDDGLAYEPADFDLLLARARLLDLGGAPTSRVRDAYAAAIATYPLSVTARIEAARLAFEAGESDLALQLARGVLEVAPENPDALAIREAAEQ